MKTKNEKLPKRDPFVLIIITLAVVFVICFIFVPQDAKQYNDIVRYFFSAAPQTMGAILGIALSALYIMMPNLARGALSEPLKKLLFSDYCLKNSVKFGLVPIASIIFIPFSSLRMPLIVEKISISLSLSLVFACGVLSIYYLTKFVTDRYELYSNYRKMLNSELGNIDNKNRNALLIELKILLVVEGKGDDKVTPTIQNNIIDDINTHISKWGDGEKLITDLIGNVINAIKNNRNNQSSCLYDVYKHFVGLSCLYKKNDYKSKKIVIDKNIELLVDLCYPLLKEDPQLSHDLTNCISKMPEDINEAKELITNFHENPIPFLFYLKLYNKLTLDYITNRHCRIKRVLESLTKNQSIMPDELYNEFIDTIVKLKIPPVPENG